MDIEARYVRRFLRTFAIASAALLPLLLLFGWIYGLLGGSWAESAGFYFGFVALFSALGAYMAYLEDHPTPRMLEIRERQAAARRQFAAGGQIAGAAAADPPPAPAFRYPEALKYYENQRQAAEHRAWQDRTGFGR